MIEVLDIVLIPAALILFALVTIPIIRHLHKRSKHYSALLVAWFLFIFVILFILIWNLASKYFNLEPVLPFVNIDIQDLLQ